MAQLSDFSVECHLEHGDNSSSSSVGGDSSVSVKNIRSQAEGGAPMTFNEISNFKKWLESGCTTMMLMCNVIE